MDSGTDLKQLRSQIGRIDEELLTLVARRQDLARQVARAKLTHALPIKDYQVEKQILANTRKRASELGIEESVAEGLVRSLIDYSCQVQEAVHGNVRGRSAQTQRRIVIAGGRGRMGQWLAQFFEAFGHVVSLYDPRRVETPGAFPTHDSLESALASAEVLVLATPLGATAALYETLIQRRPSALLVDICSLKSPILPVIAKAKDAGLRVASVHPMFGPAVQWLAGRNILVCETDDAASTDAAAALFEGSSANLVRLPLERHDELMGYVLGLSHLTNLVFGAALERSGVPYASLRRGGSTTFHSQMQVTEPVVAENQDLYFEIQTENRHTPAVLEGVRLALDDYTKAITAGDRDAFKALMEKSRRYLQSDKKAP